MTDYVELHARSAFSFLEGATMPEFLIQQAAHLEMPAMGLLDRNGLYGAARFHMEGARCGVQAHIGAEVSISDLGQCLQAAAYLPHQFPAEPVRLPLLAESRIGYQNLSRLITQFKLREITKAEGAAILADVGEYSNGLVCLTGGNEGPLAASLAQGGYDAALKTVETLVHLFGSRNVYVELQRHSDREEEHRNRAAVRIARSLNLPLLATGGVSYGTPYEREVLDIFTCIRHRKSLDTAGRLLSRNAERHLHTAAEMHRLFYDYPEAIANTRELSCRLQFQMTGLGYEFPAYPVPDGETMDSFLRKRVAEGIRRRYLPKNDSALYEKARQQAERELRLIKTLGLAGYFLIVWDVVCFCKDNGILVQGRGSAANSVVCYALEITIVDSVGLDLLFERFLSEERGEWPDIDIDLPSDTDRERAIQYVYQRYGELGAAMTANIITFRSRSASREVGKALGFDQETAAKLAGLMSAWEWKAPSDTLENSFKAAGLDMKHRRIAHYLQKCGDVLRLPRNLGQHSGGMVICQGHLDSVVPIERASMPGRTVVQWDKDDCSDMGIIKVDLLGLGMLAVLKDAAYLVPQYYGEPLDYAQLPQDDAVYATIAEADTIGLFQIESRAQMSALPRTRPKCFADLSMQVAIIRPGPVTGKFVNPYIARRLGREPVTYLHPSFKPFLERTLGVPLFQEQVMKIGMVAANLTGGEAEELRKAMGGKRSESIIAGLKTRLHEGMTANGFDAAAQEEVMRVLATVKEFMFPESHAHSFASIAYSSAYTRHHYTAAYTCALFNNQPMGFYSPATIANDAKRHGVRIVPIDVQRSDWFCTLEELSGDDRTKYTGRFAVRMGLCYVKGLRRAVAEDIMEARLTDGLFTSEYDLRRRVQSIKKGELVLLAKAGAFNWTGEKHHRRTALWYAERAGQNAEPLFENIPDEHELGAVAPLRPMTTEERLVADFDSTGVTLGPHPMAYHRREMNAAGVLPAAHLKGMPDGMYACIAGAVIARQRPGTAEGFIFLSLEDETGVSNAIIHPHLYERNRVTVTRGKFLRVEGTLQNQDGVINVRASAVHILALSDIDVRSHDFH
ncbi:DNA polymerase III subunit alpha [Tunturibacter empetritectus]|uniref:Error-prone DNA polymerase n=2 Tax=Tunturiibacter empetritectus TaxID=3069691 RepID=A0A7W8IGM0_9BACT|nr:error-prone DNA polymerase [Edaphobacter lichenicola]MBB5316657.1 error-prone DNA polymerase [Edaphobacter lichenicola]